MKKKWHPMQSACQQCTLKCGCKSAFLRLWLTSLSAVRGLTNPRGDSDPPPTHPVILFETLMLESTQITFKFLLWDSDFRAEEGGESLPLTLSQVSLVRGASSPGSERSRWPPELRSPLKKPGVCSNYSHKGTLVMEMPLSWIERSASRCL